MVGSGWGEQCWSVYVLGCVRGDGELFGGGGSGGGSGCGGGGGGALVPARLISKPIRPPKRQDDRPFTRMGA